MHIMNTDKKDFSVSQENLCHRLCINKNPYLPTFPIILLICTL